MGEAGRQASSGAKVDVTGVAPESETVVVPDTAVRVDGQTLRSLELIGSTGDTESFGLTSPYGSTKDFGTSRASASRLGTPSRLCVRE